MQQLDIKEGDVVRFDDNTKNTAAVCLALDEDRNYVTHKNAKIYDIEIEYKSEDSSEKQDPYLKIRINNW